MINLYFECLCQQINNLLEHIHYLSALMLSNEFNAQYCIVCVCLASPISLKGWMDVKSGPFRGEESSSDLSTSWQDEENTWPPRGFGRGSSISWYNKVRHRPLLLQPFIWLIIKVKACVWGTSAQWCVGSPNTLGAQRKRWGLSFATDEHSWDTLNASQHCLADSHNTAHEKGMCWAGSDWALKHTVLFSWPG